MTFTESIKTCIVNKYAMFKGRAKRSEYWWFRLFFFIICLLAYLVSMIHPVLQIIALLIVLAFIIPMWSVSLRRYHDGGYSETYWFLGRIMPDLFPIIYAVLHLGGPFTIIYSAVGILALLDILWTCTRSDGDNEYGKDV